MFQCGELCHGRAGDNHFQASLSQVSARTWPSRPFGRQAGGPMIGPRHLTSASLLASLECTNTTKYQHRNVEDLVIVTSGRILEAENDWSGSPAYSPTH